MGHQVRGDLGRLPPGSGDRPRLFTTRCGRCPVNQICGERDSMTACGEPAEYRKHALLPERVHLGSTSGPLHTFPASPIRWATSFELPPVIPVAPDGTRDFPSMSAVDAVGALGLRGRAGAAVACLAANDMTLERIWRRRSRLGSHLRNAGLELVIAPAFSLWWADPPYEGLHEIARTAEVAARLARHIATVPAVVWRTNTDIARWAEWLGPTSPGFIAVDFSTLKRRIEWRWAMEGLRELAVRLREHQILPHLVAVGPSAPSRLREVRDTWLGNITIASRSVWQISRAGIATHPDGTREKLLDFAFEDLLERNIDQMSVHLASEAPTTSSRYSRATNLAVH
jgi:hypothetical protein